MAFFFKNFTVNYLLYARPITILSFTQFSPMGGCLLNSSKLEKIVKTLFAHFFPNCTLDSIYYQLNILKLKTFIF